MGGRVGFDFDLTQGLQELLGPAVADLVALVDAQTVLVKNCAGTVCHARTTVDLHAAHLGHPVLIVFENNDPLRPIVIGVLQGHVGWPVQDTMGAVELQADGKRLVVTASEQLTLRCGSARITLTRDGKVLIEGTYVSSRSTGVNRVRGGSVHLN